MKARTAKSSGAAIRMSLLVKAPMLAPCREAVSLSHSMSRRSRFWWRNTLLLALILVAVVSLWSWWVQPETTQLGFARIPGGASSSVVLNNLNAKAPGNQPCPAWRMHLRMDHNLKSPGSAWLMFEGAKVGDGYELAWQPQRLSLTLSRSKITPLVLGVTSLDHVPVQIALVRHGFHLEVWADEVLALSVLDPQTTAAATAWGFQAAGPMEGTISLHDDRRLLSLSTAGALAGDEVMLERILADPTADHHALFLTRQVLTSPSQKTGNEVFEKVRADALKGVADAAQPIRDELHQWLAWSDIHEGLSRPERDAAMSSRRTVDAVDKLLELMNRHPANESAGLTMELLEGLVRTCSRPPRNSTPEEVVRWRDRWFDILARCAASTLTHSSPAIPDDWRWQLQLIIHSANTLRGRPPKPTPAEAPEWVVSRWRAFAGGNPGGTVFSNPIPVVAEERNPVRPALESLIQLAAFDPGGLAAVTMTAAIMDALESPMPPNAGPEVTEDHQRENRQRALAAINTTNAQAREAALAKAILALHVSNSDPDEALRLLDVDDRHQAPTNDGTTPLARSDPLAFALYRLIQHRRQIPRARSEGPFATAEPLPAALSSSFGLLLSGRAEATQEAWSTNPAVLPPIQALAAALAMQEVFMQGAATQGAATQGATKTALPNWALLDQLPCFTLPLRLMKPVNLLPHGQDPGKHTVVP